MKHFILFFMVALFFNEDVYSQAKKDTVFVNDHKTLVASIKSNRVIILTTKHIALSREDFVIDSIENLKITGNLTEQTKITTSDTGNTVITFKNSKNITLNNLSIGHWPDVGYCEGNVLDIIDCDKFTINNSDLFGSGVIGLYLRSSNVWCTNTVIRDCSENIIDSRKSSLVFDKCSFYLNKQNELNYPGPKFKTCKFYNYKRELISNDYNSFYPPKPLSINAIAIAEYPAWSLDENYDGEFESACPNTFKITTSSHLTSNKNISYSGENLNKIALENEANVAWVEGVEGNGVGEKIFLEVKSVLADFEPWELIGEFVFVNGYAKNESTWQNNNRVKKFRIRRNNHTVANINLLDTPNTQSFDLGDIVYKNGFTVGEILEFEIVEIYKGNKYDDTAISFLSARCIP